MPNAFLLQSLPTSQLPQWVQSINAAAPTIALLFTAVTSLVTLLLGIRTYGKMRLEIRQLKKQDQGVSKPSTYSPIILPPGWEIARARERHEAMQSFLVEVQPIHKVELRLFRNLIILTIALGVFVPTAKMLLRSSWIQSQDSWVQWVLSGSIIAAAVIGVVRTISTMVRAIVVIWRVERLLQKARIHLARLR